MWPQCLGGPDRIGEPQQSPARRKAVIRETKGRRRLRASAALVFKFRAASYLPFLGAFLSSFLAFFFIQSLLYDVSSTLTAWFKLRGLAAPATCSSARYKWCAEESQEKSRQRQKNPRSG